MGGIYVQVSKIFFPVAFQQYVFIDITAQGNYIFNFFGIGQCYRIAKDGTLTKAQKGYIFFIQSIGSASLTYKLFYFIPGKDCLFLIVPFALIRLKINGIPHIPVGLHTVGCPNRDYTKLFW